MVELRALPAFDDNYIWILADSSGQAIIVDPGDAAPVLAAAAQGLRPVALLLTHHHDDHTGGAAELKQHWSLPCYGPADARIEGCDEQVNDGGRIEIAALDAVFEVVSVPGHTRTHVAYVGAGRLFCGDTLFSLGCGRLFEGTPAQMLDSLDRLAALPAETEVCCGHEYTLTNARFALEVEPDNAALRERQAHAQLLRAAGRATLPSRLADESAANPFLRTAQPAVRDAVTRYLGYPPGDRVETFAALRRWKDGYRCA